MSELWSRPGLFVVLVGPDGVGKTSVARALLEQYSGPAGYFHFMPPLRGPLASDPGTPGPVPAKSAARGSTVLGWARFGRNAVRWWLGYRRTIRPALRQHALIVGDRSLYGYVAQPLALRFHGPGLLARSVLRLLPGPHLIANLSAPPDVIRQRKQELTVGEIGQELQAWSSLGLPNVRTFDARQSPQEIAREILTTLGATPKRGAALRA